MKKLSKSAIFAMTISITAIAVLFFCFPCHRYFVDGLMYSITIQDDPTRWIIHPHHPLFPFLPQVLYVLMGTTSSGFSELELLLSWSIFAGVISAWGVMVVLRAGRLTPASAITGALFFSFTRATWYFSVTPNQNSTALASQILALLAIVFVFGRKSGENSRSKLVIAGILSGLAILFSKINAIVLIPVVYLLLTQRKESGVRIKQTFQYLSVSIITALGIYIVLGFVFGGYRSPMDFLSSHHSYVYEGRWWISGFMDAIQRNFEGLVSVQIAGAFDSYGLFGNWAEGFGSSVWFIKLGIRIVQIFILAFLLIEIICAVGYLVKSEKKHLVQITGLAVLLPVVLFSLVWAPESSNYRILYYPGLIMFLMPSIESRYWPEGVRLRRAWPVFLFIILLFGNNFAFQFYPQSDPLRNPYNYEAYRLMAFAREGDLIIYSGTDEGHMRSLYATYFLDCDTILAHDLVKKLREDPEEVT